MMARRIPATNPAVAVAYLRVSTDEQRLGPEAQRAAIEAWAVRLGVQVVAWHADQGVSGAAPLEKRPALLAALAELRSAGAGVLVVARRDRLARDVMIAALVERLCERDGARVLSAAGEGGEATDPSGVLMRTVVDAFSQYERALIRARTSAALAAKKARGERVGGLPWGFRHEAGRLVPDEREQQVLELARALRAEGRTLRAVVAELAARGVTSRRGRPLSLATVAQMMSAGTGNTG